MEENNIFDNTLTHTHTHLVKKAHKNFVPFRSRLFYVYFLYHYLILSVEWNWNKIIKRTFYLFFLLCFLKKRTHNNQSFCHKLAPLPTSHFLCFHPRTVTKQIPRVVVMCWCIFVIRVFFFGWFCFFGVIVI